MEEIDKIVENLKLQNPNLENFSKKISNLVNKVKNKQISEEELKEEVDKLNLQQYGDMAWLVTLFVLYGEFK